MKKKVLGIAMAMLAMLTLNGAAQTPSGADNATCSPADCAGVNCNNRPSPYEGLTLTEAQKAQLQQLDARRKAGRDARAKARKADRQRNDSVYAAQRQADRRQYLDDVKAIVGPDEYVVFLENLVVGAPQKNAVKQGKHSKDKKHHAKDSGKRDRRAAAQAQVSE